MFSNVQKNLQIPQGPKVQIVENFVDHDNLSNSLNENNKINEPTVKQNQNNQNKNNAGDSIKKIEENDNELDSSSKNNNMEDVKENKNKIIDNEINTKQNQNNQNKNNAGDSSKKIEENDNELNSSSKINIDTKDNGNEIKNNNEINEIIMHEEQDNQSQVGGKENVIINDIKDNVNEIKDNNEINENEINEVNQNGININNKRNKQSEDDKFLINEESYNENKINENDEIILRPQQRRQCDIIADKICKVINLARDGLKKIEREKEEKERLKTIEGIRQIIRQYSSELYEDNVDIFKNEKSKEIDIFKAYKDYVEDGNNKKKVMEIFKPMSNTHKLLKKIIEKVYGIRSDLDKWAHDKVQEIEDLEHEAYKLHLDLYEDKVPLNVISMVEGLKDWCYNLIEEINLCPEKVDLFYENRKEDIPKILAEEVRVNLAKIFEKMPNLKSLFIPLREDVEDEEQKSNKKMGIVIKRQKENPGFIGYYLYDEEKKIDRSGLEVDEDELIPLQNKKNISNYDIRKYVGYYDSDYVLFPDTEEGNLSVINIDDLRLGEIFIHFPFEGNEKNSKSNYFNLHLTALYELRYTSELVRRIVKKAAKRVQDTKLDVIKEKASQAAFEAFDEKEEVISEKNAQLKEIDIFKDIELYNKKYDKDIMAFLFKKDELLKIYRPTSVLYNILRKTFENMNDIFSNDSGQWYLDKIEKIKKFGCRLNSLADDADKRRIDHKGTINSLIYDSDISYDCNTAMEKLYSYYSDVESFYKSGPVTKVIAKEAYSNLEKIFKIMPNLKNVFIPLDRSFEINNSFGTKGIVVKRKKENSNLIGCYYYDKDVVEKNLSLIKDLPEEMLQGIDKDGLISLNTENRELLQDYVAPFTQGKDYSTILFPDFEKNKMVPVKTWFNLIRDFCLYCPTEDENEQIKE